MGIRARVGEAFATLVALVGFLPRVETGVFYQVVLVFEGLPADATLMRTHSCNERGGEGRVGGSVFGFK